MMSPLVASLSGMVNVERLVDAANETDEDMDLLLDDLKRSLLDTAETKSNGRQVNGGTKDDTSLSTSSSTKNLFPFLDNVSYLLLASRCFVRYSLICTTTYTYSSNYRH